MELRVKDLRSDSAWVARVQNLPEQLEVEVVGRFSHGQDLDTLGQSENGWPDCKEFLAFGGGQGKRMPLLVVGRRRNKQGVG